MGSRSRVVLNRRGFGEVLSSVEMEEQLRPYAEDAAAQIPGASIRAVRTGVGSTSARVRLRVEGEAWQRARLISAIRTVLSNATER